MYINLAGCLLCVWLNLVEMDCTHFSECLVPGLITDLARFTSRREFFFLVDMMWIHPIPPN